MPPTFSVIMPTYNDGDRLDRAVRSVVAQTFKDWELIVVDDGSTDESTKGLIRGDERIRVHIMEQNSGSPVVPRNWGAAQASGKYLAFLDADDWWEPDKLAVMDGLNLDGRLWYHDMNLDWGGKARRWNELSTCYSGGNAFDRLLVKNFIPTSSVVIPRALWHPMDGRLKVSHDWDLWLDLARKFYVCYVPQALGTLTLRPGSVISNVRRRRRESREVVRRWRRYSKRPFGIAATLRYNLVEVWDLWRLLIG